MNKNTELSDTTEAVLKRLWISIFTFNFLFFTAMGYAFALPKESLGQAIAYIVFAMFVLYLPISLGIFMPVIREQGLFKALDTLKRFMRRPRFTLISYAIAIPLALAGFAFGFALNTLANVN